MQMSFLRHPGQRRLEQESLALRGLGEGKKLALLFVQRCASKKSGDDSNPCAYSLG